MTYHIFSNFGSFFNLPKYLSDLTEEWTVVKRPAGPLPSLIMACVTDYTLCLLFDPETKFVVGAQIGIPEDRFKNPTFNMIDQGYIPWQPKDVVIMTKIVLFISEATLKKNKEERMKTALAKKILQESSIWVTDNNQTLMEIPITESGIANTDFTKQGCFIWMGQHYYYKMSEDTLCTPKAMFNWFPLTDSGNLIGVGHVAFGSVEEKKGHTYYFERPQRLAVQAIVPHGPTCLYELASYPTLTTCHLYFIEKPRTVGCPLW